MSFDELNIDPRCLKILKGQKITEPTPVQAQAIPVVLEGRDLIAIAQTGTGKTLAFGLPALTQLAGTPSRSTRMLVLAPTRELAQQVHDVLEVHARALGLRTACVYGGVGMDRQAHALRTGAAIIVATPGRLIDHMERGNTNFKQMSVLVLDEADRMLDMGFMPSIKRILDTLPKERQTMMFSATFPKEISDLTRTMQKNAARIQVGQIASPAKDVRQGAYAVNSDKKLGLLASMLRDQQVTSALVFMRTKHRTDRIAKALHAEGFKAQAIHGGRTQRQRQQAIDGFRDGRYSVLVATDVAARGLDVQGISHVFNFDVPNCADDYVHRIGRTGRANMSGIAFTLVCPEESSAFRSIERELGNSIPRESWEGVVDVQTVSMPREESRGRQSYRDGYREQRVSEYRERSAPSRDNGQRDQRSSDSRERNAPSRDNGQREPRGYGHGAPRDQHGRANEQRPQHGHGRTDSRDRNDDRSNAAPHANVHARGARPAHGRDAAAPSQGRDQRRSFNPRSRARKPARTR